MEIVTSREEMSRTFFLASSVQTWKILLNIYFLPRSKRTHTHTLSLSLSHTHTHTLSITYSHLYLLLSCFLFGYNRQSLHKILYKNVWFFFTQTHAHTQNPGKGVHASHAHIGLGYTNVFRAHKRHYSHLLKFRLCVWGPDIVC